MSKEIYIVTEGEYSSYSIVGVFDDRELAEKMLAAVNTDRGQIETFTLNPNADDLRAGLRLFSVRMQRSGDGAEAAVAYSYELDRRQDDAFFYPDGSTLFTTTVWARDEQHAIKIANERRVQMIARGDWPEKFE